MDKYPTIQSLLPPGLNHWTGRNDHPVEGMFVHVAEGYRNGVTSWFNNPNAEASSNYLVCKDGTRVQFVRDEDTSWANGQMNHPDTRDPFIKKWVDQNINPNRRTWSVETERFQAERLTPDQQASLNELAVKGHQKYGWPADGTRIWGHYEVDSVTRSNCPSLIPAEWKSIVQAVAAAGSVVVTPSPEVNQRSYTYDMATGKYVHPDLWAHYQVGGLVAYGHPIAAAYQYSDGWTRQLFEKVVLGVKNGVVRVEGLGQAWLAQTKLPAVVWPGVRAVV